MDRDDPAWRGQSEYTPLLLRLYDPLIVDPNANVLEHASRRLAHFDLTTIQADVLKPLPLEGPYASAALHLVIHCLPGPAARKVKAIEHIAAVLEPDGVLFGASVLGRSGRHTPQARAFLKAANWNGGFDNLDDSVATLTSMLRAMFADVQVETTGSVALFAATGRHEDGAVAGT
jgi:hypothetical protein